MIFCDEVNGEIYGVDELTEGELAELKYDLAKSMYMTLAAKKVIVSNEHTIVLWNDGTKTISTCRKGDKFDVYYGIQACFMKKLLGSKAFHTKMERAMSKVEEVVKPKKTTAKRDSKGHFVKTKK